MKNTIIITIASLLLVGCNSSTSTDSGILITEKCNATDDMTNYQTLQSGDSISAREALNPSSTVPEVEILHTASGVKKVCIKDGSVPAYIYR